MLACLVRLKHATGKSIAAHMPAEISKVFHFSMLGLGWI